MKKIFLFIFLWILLLSCSKNDNNIDNQEKINIIQEKFSSWVIMPNIPNQPDL